MKYVPHLAGWWLLKKSFLKWCPVLFTTQLVALQGLIHLGLTLQYIKESSDGCTLLFTLTTTDHSQCTYSVNEWGHSLIWEGGGSSYLTCSNIYIFIKLKKGHSELHVAFTSDDIFEFFEFFNTLNGCHHLGKEFHTFTALTVKNVFFRGLKQNSLQFTTVMLCEYLCSWIAQPSFWTTSIQRRLSCAKQHVVI